MPTYCLKIQLQGIKSPAVWRTITVPGHYTFHRLNYVIQAAFGWTNSHIYHFCNKPLAYTWRITHPDYFDEELDIYEQDACQLTLDQSVEGLLRGDLLYEYDLGDNWRHKITLLDILPENTRRAKVEAGAGLCPPEDVGGPHGYEELKKTFARSPFENDYRAWLGMEPDMVFDPKHFSKAESDNAVKKACSGLYWIEIGEEVELEDWE